MQRTTSRHSGENALLRAWLDLLFQILIVLLLLVHSGAFSKVEADAMEHGDAASASTLRLRVASSGGLSLDGHTIASANEIEARLRSAFDPEASRRALVIEAAAETPARTLVPVLVALGSLRRDLAFETFIQEESK